MNFTNADISKKKKWLKVLHVYLGGIWGGGAASLFAIHCLYPTNSGPELYARNMAMIYIVNYIIIPAAIGSSNPSTEHDVGVLF